MRAKHEKHPQEDGSLIKMYDVRKNMSIELLDS